MKEALAAAGIATLVTLGTVIASADIIVNRHTVYAAIFGVTR